MSPSPGTDPRTQIKKKEQAPDEMPVVEAGYIAHLRRALKQSPVKIRDRVSILVNARAVEEAVNAKEPLASEAALVEFCRKVETFDRAIIDALPSAGEASEELKRVVELLLDKNPFMNDSQDKNLRALAIEQAAKHGVPYAQFRLGEHLIHSSSRLPKEAAYSNYSMAEGWLNKAADQGHIQSDYLLGLFYHAHNASQTVVIPHRNLPLAVQHMKRAALAGHMAAQYNMGIFCKNGVEMTPDPSGAFEWFRRCAVQGYAEAQNAMGRCYMDGEGVKSDPKSAVKWFKLAALQGHAPAMYRLAECLTKNLPEKGFRSEGVRWAQKALERKHARAGILLAECYLEGIGVRRDPEEAVKYLKLPYNETSMACKLLAQCYEHGTGVEQNPLQAQLLYREAAEGAGTTKAIRKQLPYIIIEDHWAR